MSTTDNNNQHYRVMFSENRAVMLLIDPNDGMICDASVGACDYYGYTLAELTAKKISDINTMSEEEVASEMRRAREGEKNHFYFRHRLSSGEVRDVEVYSNPVFLDGKPYLYSVIHDISKRKVAEEALRQSEEVNRGIIETSQDWIWAIDLEGTHVYSNPAVTVILGYTVAEIVGRQCLELVHEEDREWVAKNMENWIRNKQGWRNLVLRWCHKDGGYRYLESNAVPSFNSSKELVGFRGVDRDITERKRIEESLRESEAKYHLAMEATQDGLWDWDMTTNYVYYSPAWSRILGVEKVINTYTTWEQRIHPEDKERILDSLRAHLDGKSSFWQEEHRLHAEDGSWLWVLGRGKVVNRDNAGKPLRMVGTMSDITERKHDEEKLEFLATHDSLTGLYNRKSLEQLLGDELHRAFRYDHALSLFMLDLDHFKPINDTYGHQSGDAVLRCIGNIIQESIRKTDFAARYGGEEFVIVLTETATDEAEDLAERLRLKIADHAISIGSGADINITASIGVSSYPEHGGSYEDLINAADTAMYAAKEAGRNCIRLAKSSD